MSKVLAATEILEEVWDSEEFDDMACRCGTELSSEDIRWDPDSGDANIDCLACGRRWEFKLVRKYEVSERLIPQMPSSGAEAVFSFDQDGVSGTVKSRSDGGLRIHVWINIGEAAVEGYNYESNVEIWEYDQPLIKWPAMVDGILGLARQKDNFACESMRRLAVKLLCKAIDRMAIDRSYLPAHRKVYADMAYVLQDRLVFGDEDTNED